MSTGCLVSDIERLCVGGKPACALGEVTIGGSSFLLPPSASYDCSSTDETSNPRINWSGSALSTFYAAIRKALVVVIVARALGVLFGLAFAGWWIFGS